MPVGAPRGDHGDAGGERGHRLAEQGAEVVGQAAIIPSAWVAAAGCRRRRPPPCACRRGRGRSRGGRCAGARRGSPRARGRSGRSGGRAGRGRRSSSRRPSARARSGRRAARARRGSAGGGRRRRLAASGSSRGIAGGSAPRARRQRRPAAEHQALRQRVRRQPVGAVQPGAGALADREQPRQRRAPVEVGCDAAHRVVGGGRDRHELVRGVDAGLRRARPRCSGSAPPSTVRMSSCTALCAAPLELGEDRQRHLVARRQLVHEALAVARRAASAPSPRTASVIRKPSRGPVVHERRRVELRELEVGQLGARGVRQRHAGADRAGRVGGALPERGRAAGGQHRAAGEHRPRRARSRSRATSPAQRPSSTHDRRAAVVRSSTSTRSSVAARAASSRVIRRPVALPPACTTRRAEWPPSSPSASAPWRSASKRTPRRSRSRTRSGASSHSTRTALSRAAPRPAASVSCGVALGRVVGAPARRRSRPAPSSWPSRAAASARPRPRARPRARRRSRRTARPRRPRRRRRRPAAVPRTGFSRARSAGTVAPSPPRSTSTTRPRSSTTPARMHPERPERIPGDRARARRARTGSGSSAARRRGPSASGSRPCTPRRTSTAWRSTARAARRSTPTLPRARARGRPPCASAGGACAMVEELMSGRRPYGFCGLRPPGHHAEPERAMGFCLFANVSLAARHALDSLGAERVFVLDWDVHHGNGTEAVWWSSPEVLFASIHQWPFYPGTGALPDAGAGRGRGLHDQHAGPGGRRARRVPLAGGARGAAGRARVPARPDPASRPATTPTATTRWPTAG